MAGLKMPGSIWYVTYYANRKKRLVSLETDSLQLAKEKKQQFESAKARGDSSSPPTRTAIADVLTGYVQHIRTVKTAKSAHPNKTGNRSRFLKVPAIRGAKSWS